MFTAIIILEGKLNMINQLITVLLLIPGFWLGYKFSPQFIDWVQKNPKRPLRFSPG